MYTALSITIESGSRKSSQEPSNSCRGPPVTSSSSCSSKILAAKGRHKEFNYVSTTFVFGWAVKSVLHETDLNENMELIDFGYSQSKWVAEQVVVDARSRGLSARIFRPALVSPSVTGGGNNFDIAVRLVAFMVNHGIGVDTLNQVSFVPADIVANNIVAISTTPVTANKTYHVTRDDYS